MTDIKKNIFANFSANIWVAVLSLAFVPLYIKFLGIEAYGLIGIFISFQSFLALLDLGLSFAVNRELARLSVHSNNGQKMRDLLRTLEIIYFLVAILVFLIVFVLSGLIASKWIDTGEFSVNEVTDYLTIMGAVFAARWPYALYSGALMGIQKQVPLNIMRVVLETARGGGSVLVLWLISPSLLYFLSWQLVVAVCGTLCSRIIAWRHLPEGTKKPRFSAHQLRNLAKFALGSSVIGITVVILSQMDKLILTKMISLEHLGYYILGGALSGGLIQLSSPIFSAYYPKISQTVANGNLQNLKEVYHKACQMMSVAILPAGVVVMMFSFEVIYLWTGDKLIAEKTHNIVSFLIAGTMINAIMQIPYALQLAYGWLKLTFYINLVSIIIIIPLIIISTLKWGVEGAALGWFVLNASYLIVTPHLVYKRLLTTEKIRWYVYDVGIPISAAILAGTMCRYLFFSLSISNNFFIFTFIFSSYIVILLAVSLCVPWLRNKILTKTFQSKIFNYG